MSDLHFGRTDPIVVKAIRDIANRLDPHLIVVSGDLTQRAREREFIAARAFLDSIGSAPKLVVPGNHDVPLYNVFARFLRPLRHYRKYIADDVEPVFIDDEIVVAGISTARSLTWKQGRINRGQVGWARQLFCSAVPGRIRILVSHHPFDLPPQAGSSDLVGRAPMAIAEWRDCEPDLFLGGHSHLQATGTTAVRYSKVGASIVVQAGTTTSRRVRGEQNSFNLIRTSSERVEVDRYDWNATGQTFNLESVARFVRTDRGWVARDAAGT
ncbi:MAG: metallophosphoesterase family protein [Casimicrobiaceae bacterium]